MVRPLGGGEHCGAQQRYIAILIVGGVPEDPLKQQPCLPVEGVGIPEAGRDRKRQQRLVGAAGKIET